MLKSEKKYMILILIAYFILLSTSKILSFQHAINIKIITEVVSTLSTKFFKSDVYFIHHSTSLFREATFHVLNKTVKPAFLASFSKMGKWAQDD